MASCYRHPSRETGVACSNCGRPICPDCMTTTPVGMRCPECARERTRVRRYSGGAFEQPTVTYALIVVNVIVELASLLGGGSGAAGLGSSAILRDGALSRATVAHGDVWRIVTSGFIHAGLTHLLLSFTISGISIGGHIGGLVGGTLAAIALYEVGPRLRLPFAVTGGLVALLGAAAVAGAIGISA